MLTSPVHSEAVLERPDLHRVDRRQPVNLSHPLMEDLEGLWLPLPYLAGGSRLYDLSALARHGTLQNAATWEHNPQRAGVRLDGSADTAIRSSGPLDYEGQEWTVLALIRDADPGSSTKAVVSGGDYDQTGAWGFRYSQYQSTGQVGYSIRGGDDYTSSLASPSSGVIAASVVDNDAVEVYVNGSTESLSITSHSNTTNDFVLGGGEFGGGVISEFIGVIEAVQCVYGHAWPVSRMEQWDDQARRGFPELLNTRTTTVPLGAAGAVITASLTEGAQASESFSVSATLAASMNEGALGSDTLGSTSTLTDAIAEGAQGGETWATTLTALASIDEGALSTEQFTATVFTAIQAAIQEGSQASETFLSTLQAKADLLEGASASETFTGTVIGPDTITATITEAAQAGESVTATASLVADLVEGATSSETLAASAILRAALTESGQAGDTFTAQVLALVLADISETAEPGETFSAQTDLTATLTESALAGSTFTASSTLRGGITEGAAASEQIAVLTASKWLEGTIRIAAKLAGTPDVEDKLDGSPDIEPKD